MALLLTSCGDFFCYYDILFCEWIGDPVKEKDIKNERDLEKKSQQQ